MISSTIFKTFSCQAEEFTQTGIWQSVCKGKTKIAGGSV
jgi:hypothetical protein